MLTGKESVNIVKYPGFEIFDEKLVMVMKYVNGGSLRNMMGKIGHCKRIDIPIFSDLGYAKSGFLSRPDAGDSYSKFIRSI